MPPEATPEAPLVSVIVMTYRQAAFIEETLQTVLAQTYTPMEVLVWDDHSPDDTWTIIERTAVAYAGPHTLRIHRQPENLGGVDNALSAIAACRGALLIQSHGDDLPYPDRVARIVDLWQRTGASMITHDVHLYEDGQVGERQVATLPHYVPGDRQLTAERLAARSFIPEMQGATMAFERTIFDCFEPWDNDKLSVFGPGDNILPFRAALLGGLWYLDAPLTRWRQHKDQVTKQMLQVSYTDQPVDVARGRETIYAFFVTALLQRMRDLQYRMAQVPESERRTLHKLLQQTLRTLIQNTGHWSESRDVLHASPLTLRWPERGGGTE